MTRLDTVVRDLRYGARQLRANPAFTVIAVLSLALGIGANTAIFQLIDAVRLRTLPVAHPEELAYIEFAKGSMYSGWFSTRSARWTYAHWEEIQKEQQAFSGIAAWSAVRFNLAAGGEARYAEGLYVNADFFRVLGVEPVIGRTFAPEEDRIGCGAPGAVISYAFWRRDFAADLGVLGRTVSLDGRAFPIIGVTPPGFFGVEVGNRYDVAVPLCADNQKRIGNATAWWLSMMGRLKPGWTVARASAHFQALSPAVTRATLPSSYQPDAAKRYLSNKIVATPGATGVSGLRREYEDPLWLLLATTGLVLLIACANLANLLLARASVREREIAIRQAIGASRGRLIGQLLSESLLISLLGAGIGVLIAQILSRGLIAFLSRPNDPLFVGLPLDGRMLAFTAAVAFGTCLLFGLLPSLRATRVAPASVMRAGGRGLTAGRERFSLRRVLVVAQVAMSLVLLVGALLFAQSLNKLTQVDPGFRSAGVLAMELDLRQLNYPKERRPVVFREALDRIRSQPGVLSAAEVNITPVSGSSWNSQVRADGSAGKYQESFFNSGSSDYFRTMGIGFLAGRDFDDRDTATSTKVAIVNEAFVKRFFGAGNPVGRAFRVRGDAGKPDPIYQVVGLVRNSKYREIREEFLPIAFLSMAQDDDPGTGMTYVVRTAGTVGGSIQNLKTAMAQVNPGAGLDFHVFKEQIANSLLRERLMATLAGAFGLLAALLATLGLYGVIAYMVARRQNEIGVRMALGADRGRVVTMVLGEAATLLAVGIVVGAGVALWAGRAAAAMLFGLQPRDPVTLAAAALLLASVALAASYVPARRAARIEPVQALRQE